MAVLPPVEQVFTANADAFLATIDAMVAATDRLAESIDLVAASADRLGGGATAAAVADDRIVEAADAAAAAVDRQIVAMDELAATMDRNVGAIDANTAALDEQALAADRTAVSNDRAGRSSASMASKGKVAFLAVAAAMVYSVVKAAEFQQQMTTLLTQAQVAPKQFKYLENGVLQLAGAVGFSPQSLGKALYFIESNFQSTGITGAKALDLLKIAAEGAATGHADLIDTTTALNATVAAGVPGIHSYAGAMGALNAIVGSGEMTMQQLNEALSSGIMAMAKAYSQNIYQVGAAIATLSDNNIRGAKAATDLRMTWQALQAPMKAGIPILQSLGLAQNQLATEMRTHGLSSALGMFIAHLKASKVPIGDWGQYVTEIFGKRAGVGIMVLLDNLKRLDGKLPDIKRGADDFGKAWATQQKTVSQQWKDLLGNLDTLAVSFGEVLLPAVTKVITWINKLFQAIDKHPLIMKIVGALVALAAATIMVEGAMAGLTAVMDVNPITLIIIAVLALAVGLYELYKHCKTVRDAVHDVAMFFKSVWADAVKAAGAVVKWFVDGPLKWLQAQLKLFSDFWKQHGAQLREVAKVVWSDISKVISTDWNIIYGFLKAGLNFFVGLWRAGWAIVSGIVRLAWNVIGQIIHTALTLILGLIGITLDLLTGKWARAGDDLRHLTAQIFDDVRHIIATIVSSFGGILFNAGKAAIQGLINGVRSMFGAVGNAISDVGHLIKSFFPFSPAKQGPLSGRGDLYYSGISMIDSLNRGIRERARKSYPDYYRIAADISLGLSTGLINSIPMAVRAAHRLMAEVYAAAASGQISGMQEASLLARIRTDLARAETHVEKAKEKLKKDLRDWALTIRAGVLKALADATTPGQVKSAIDKLLTIVKDAFNAGDITYRKATRLTDFLERDNTRLGQLATERGNILKTIAAAQKYAATTTSNVESWAGLSNNQAITAANSAGGGLYSGDILANMQNSLATIRQFAAAIAKLKQLGLNNNLLDQIIQMGPDQGLQVAQALIAGPLSVIKSMNATQTAINKAATGLGQTAADAMYDSGKNAGKGFLSGLESQQAALEKMMEKIARRMVQTIKRELGIRSPSTVGHYHGLMWVAGIAEGMDAGAPMIDAAGKRLALAMGHHPGPMLTTPGGAGGGGDTIHVNLTVNGFVGNNQELLRELTLLVQKGVLQLNKRNPGNPLSLSSGRYA